MKRILHIFIPTLSLFVFSCTPEITGSGSISTQTYTPVANFTKVSVDHAINVSITYGTQKNIYVTGYDNLLDYLKISASGGLLKIGMKTEYTYANMNLTANVVMPSFTELIVTNAGSISIDSFTNNIPNLILQTSGSGNIASLKNLSIGSLNANISNVGFIDIIGTVGMQSVNITGSGNYNAFGLYSDTTTVNSTTSGNAFVNAEFRLYAIINGSGNISYKGFPIIDSTITGTGILINAN